MKESADDITESSRGTEGHEKNNFQLCLEGIRTALHSRSPGSDYMGYLHDIQGKGCKCRLEANGIILKTTHIFLNK